MRQQIPLSDAIKAAWAERTRRIQNAGCLWSDANCGMRFAQDLWQRRLYDSKVAEADAWFYSQVVSQEGPQTVVEIVFGELKLFRLEPTTSAV